jgi:DNA-binding transcriptional MerR regulator
MAPEQHTIGEVLNRLKSEFEDVTISKIRFLETEGLIEPERSESGYRQFSTSDVERLRYILRAQRDRYLPLRVIREELARLDAGLPIETESGGPPSEQPRLSGSGVSSLLSDVALDRAELAHAGGLGAEVIAQLIDHGILDASGPYDGHALRVARLASELLRRGLEPRHLRAYRLAAEREASLIEQRVAPLLRQRNPDSRRQAASQAQEMAELGAQLRVLLLEGHLPGLLGS